VIGQLADDEEGDNREYEARHVLSGFLTPDAGVVDVTGSGAEGRWSPTSCAVPGERAETSQQQRVGDGDDGQRHDDADQQVPVRPDLLPGPRTLHQTAAPTAPLPNPAEDGVRRPGADQAGRPDDGADADADADAAQVRQSVVGGQAAVDTERHEGEQAGVLVRLA